jgi:hypothetical protein
MALPKIQVQYHQSVVPRLRLRRNDGRAMKLLWKGGRGTVSVVGVVGFLKEPVLRRSPTNFVSTEPLRLLQCELTSFKPFSLNCSARRCSAGAAGVIGMAHTYATKASTAIVTARMTAGV